MADNDAFAADSGRDALALSGLLAERLCHDVGGPAGTILNALALAQEDPASAEEAYGLAREATDRLVRRVKLLQAAWGMGGGPMTVSELSALAQGLGGRRVFLALDGLDQTGGFAAGAARVVLNVMMLGVESLPDGGVLAINGAPSGQLLVTIEGARAAWPAGFAGWLASEAVAWDRVAALAASGESGRMQGPLTALIAHSEGIRVSLLIAPVAESAPPLLLDLAGVQPPR